MSLVQTNHKLSNYLINVVTIIVVLTRKKNNFYATLCEIANPCSILSLVIKRHLSFL